MDLCVTCKHAWHGLPCERKTVIHDYAAGYSVTEKCKCSGPFGVPVLTETSKTNQTKGIW